MSIKAIILGILAVILMDTVWGVAWIAIFSGDISEESLKTLQTDTGALWFAMVFGTVSTVVGGYIAARIAKEAIYLNSGMVGAIGICLSLFVSGEYPLWFTVLSHSSTLPSALLGGYLASMGQSSYAYDTRPSTLYLPAKTTHASGPACGRDETARSRSASWS